MMTLWPSGPPPPPPPDGRTLEGILALSAMCCARSCFPPSMLGFRLPLQAEGSLDIMAARNNVLVAGRAWGAAAFRVASQTRPDVGASQDPRLHEPTSLRSVKILSLLPHTHLAQRFLSQRRHHQINSCSADLQELDPLPDTAHRCLSLCRITHQAEPSHVTECKCTSPVPSRLATLVQLTEPQSCMLQPQPCEDLRYIFPMESCQVCLP